MKKGYLHLITKDEDYRPSEEYIKESYKFLVLNDEIFEFGIIYKLNTNVKDRIIKIIDFPHQFFTYLVLTKNKIKSIIKR
jgi:hypothetical protein